MPDAPEAVTDARPGRLEPGALILIALLAGVLSWWAWQEGAYFGVVLLPGIVVLCAASVLLVTRIGWPIELRRSVAVAVAVAALIGLGAWTLLSALWSPVPDVAIADGQRVLAYALLFGLALWLASLLEGRLHLAMTPVAAAGAFAGVAAAVALATGDSLRGVVETDGTLDFPLGYRNANAAFFAICLFPAIGIAAAREGDWRLRALGLGTAAICLDMMLLSQSRGAIPALLVALVIFALLSPFRVRALCWLALACLSAAGIVPALTDLYAAVNDDGLRSSVGEMNAAGVIALVTAGAGVGVGAIAARLEPRLPSLGRDGTAGNRAVVAAIVAGLVLATLAFVAAVGSPARWIDDRWEEFRDAGTPNLSEESSRFTINAGSNRYDLWRVALDDLAEDPLLGDGAGGFEYEYTREREVRTQDARDAHGLPFETLAELGLPGFLLVAAAVAGAVGGALRSRRRSPEAAALVAVGLGGGTYWLLHGSIDWFWAYPAITGSAMVLLGAACAPTVTAPAAPAPRPGVRAGVAVGLAVLAISALPPFLAERYLNEAYAGWRSDLDRAYDDLDRAGSLNRLSVEPVLAEGSIARETGDARRAAEAFEEAVRRRPEGWAPYYLLAELEAESDPAAAREWIRVARELNPLSRPVAQLARRLEG